MTGEAEALARESDRTPVRRDEMTAPWFDGLASGRLLLRACSLGHMNRPDLLACDVCGTHDLTWAESSSRGVIVSHAVDHSTRPSTRLVIVELAEGPWLVTRLEGAGDVSPGGAVVVRMVRPAEGEPYPVVVPADGY
jgi:uncharacterized OB-fold protein